MSYVKLYYHIIWRTYKGEKTLPEDKKRLIFAYIHRMCETYSWKLLRANGYLDHVHLLMALKPTDTVSKVVQEIKGATSAAFKNSHDFPAFKGWNKGYGCFTLGYREVPVVRQYIIHQEAHHAAGSTEDEFRRILGENGIEPGQYDEW